MTTRTPSAPPAAAVPATAHAPNTPVPVSVLLQGFDTFSGSARSTALTGELGPEEAANVFDSKIVTTKEEINDYVGVSASLAASTAYVSGDAKAKFVSNLETTSTSVSLVVMVRRAIRQAYTNVELAGPVPEDLAAFYRAYGDAFVSSLTTGSEYIAVFTFFSNDEKKQQDVEAALKAKGLSGSVSGEMDAKLKEAQRDLKVTMTIAQWMDGVDNIAYPDANAEAITKFAQNFSTLPRTNRKVLSSGQTGYESVPGMPPMGNIVANRSKFEGGEMGGIAAQIVRLADVNQKCNAIRDAYQAYGYTGDLAFDAKAAQNVQDGEAADEWLAKVRADPTELHPVPSFASLKIGYPSVTVVRTDGDAWGAPRGQQFDDDSYYPGQSVRSISIRGGDWVDALIISYTAPGHEEWVANHGGTGGQPSRTLKLADDEVITRITGTLVDTKKFHGVGSLAFTTSKGQVLHWPLKPHKESKSFSWDVPQGWRLAGFQSLTTDKYLTKLKPILKRFGPARWVPFPSSPEPASRRSK